MKKSTSALLMAISGVLGAAAGAGAVQLNFKKKTEYYEKRIEKFQSYFDLTNEWIRLKNEGQSLSDYFEKNNWHHIAIYGMGELGNRLVEELRGSGVEIDYAIDQYVDRVNSEIDVRDLSSELPEVDVIVITPFYAYDSVEKNLICMVDYPIVSIEDVVYNS